jgi:hypothetical protein
VSSVGGCRSQAKLEPEGVDVVDDWLHPVGEERCVGHERVVGPGACRMPAVYARSTIVCSGQW